MPTFASYDGCTQCCPGATPSCCDTEAGWPPANLNFKLTFPGTPWDGYTASLPYTGPPPYSWELDGIASIDPAFPDGLLDVGISCGSGVWTFNVQFNGGPGMGGFQFTIIFPGGTDDACTTQVCGPFDLTSNADDGFVDLTPCTVDPPTFSHTAYPDAHSIGVEFWE